MHFVKCNLCNSENFIYLFSASNYLLSQEERVNIVRCKDCGLVFVNPRPADEQLNKYYSAEYFLQIPEPVFFKRFFALDKVRFVKNLKSKGRLLDVGCGRAEFLQQMEDLGWDVCGLDTSEVACKYTQERLKRGKIFNQDLLISELPENYFDIVTFWHTLEHLNDPLSSLIKVRQILKKDGLLVINCPNFSSYTSKFSKNRWFALSPPMHLYQFSPLTLRKLLNRTGFKISRLIYGSDLFTDMVTFKFSLLNWLDKEGFMFLNPNKILSKKEIFPKKFWITVRFLVNIFCLFSSMLLATLRMGDSILCLCEAVAKGDESS